MNSHAKWLREAAKICLKANLVNIANTCEQGAAEIDRLEALKAKTPRPTAAVPQVPTPGSAQRFHDSANEGAKA